MTTKFDHIRLSRAFRPIALAALKDAPSWAQFCVRNGLSGSTEALTKGQIHAACEACGVDLQALFDAHQGVDIGNETDDPDMSAGELNAMIAHASNAPPPIVDDGSFEGADVDALIAETLAAASAHMTPHLAGMMPALIRPLAEAAVRGPRVVTQTVVQTVDADGAVINVPSSYAPPSVNVLSTTALHLAFGLRKSDAPMALRHAWENIRVQVCDYVDAPVVDDDYVWNPEVLTQLAAQDVSGLNAWLFGAAGTGKTEGVRQYAARLGRPFVRIAIDRTTEPQELIGQEVPGKSGGMVWSDGKLTRAFRTPHCVILLDEPTLLRSGTLSVLGTALDTRTLHLVTGETVNAAPGVFIVAADNTAGNGDDTGRYVDTAPINAAFLDRFALKTEMTALSVGQEVSMISHRTGVHPAVAKIMVDYANLTRSNADSGKLTMGVTPRRLLAWARVCTAGIPSDKAWRSVIVTGAAPEDREVLAALEATSLRSKHPEIDGIVRGTIDPNAPRLDPVAQGMVGPTANKFPDLNEDA